MKRWIFSSFCRAIFIIVGIISFYTHTASAGEINCDLNRYYTRMNIKWNDTHVNIRVENPRGFENMPQLEMPVSESNIPGLQKQSDELRKLGDMFEYRWEKRKCKFSEDNKWLVSCEGRGEKVGEDIGINALIFTTAVINEVSHSGKQETLRLRFIFDKENLYFVAIPFPTRFCTWQN